MLLKDYHFSSASVVGSIRDQNMNKVMSDKLEIMPGCVILNCQIEKIVNMQRRVDR